MVCALGLLFALYACQSKTPERRLVGISPGTMRSDQPVEITITGDGFLDVPSVELGSSSRAELRRSYRVQLPPSDFETELMRAGPKELKFTPPLDLPDATYSVRVVPPLGAALLLQDALTILPAALADASTPMPNERRLSLETSPDGDGEVITSRTLSINETLQLYAVFREPDGSVSAQSQTVQFSLSRMLAELSDVATTSCVIRALLPGKIDVLAQAGSLRAAAEISMISDYQNELADLRLSLESEPGGTGHAYRSGQKQAAGKVLNVHAVVRDKSDAFVIDVPVTWSVNGVEAQDAAQTTSFLLPLTATGETALRARHAELGEIDLRFDVSAGRATRLTITPASASVRAGDPALNFSVSAVDEHGNATSDVGDLEYSVSEGDLVAFDSLSATLFPERIGVGRVTAKSSYGPEVTSGTIQVSAGPLARLSISPDSLQLTADDAPVQFEVSGVDDFDNEADLGDVTWSIASGAIGRLSADGALDPTSAGVGTIRASSSQGVTARSGPITIVSGKAVTLSLSPETWQGLVGGATQAFAVTGSDGDGNSTSDVGALSYGVTGPIRTIDVTSGVFTPTVAGQGTVTVSSSYGSSAATGDILVSNPNATVTIQDLRVSGTLYHGATTRVEVDVRSNDVVDVVLTGLGFAFTGSGFGDISSQYTVVPDSRNVDRIAPNVTQTLGYWLSVAGNAGYEGTVNTTVRGEAFMSAGTSVSLSRTVSSNVSYPAFGTGLTIDAPVPPADRACTGGRIAFGATASQPFSYAWWFPEGTVAPGSSLDDRYPSVDYNSVGPKANAVTAYYSWLVLTYPTTLVGKPVFIGTATSVPEDTYPTGRVVFSSPTANQNIALSSFPRSNLIVLDPAVPLRQCNNVAVSASGHNDLTIFSDRKLIDPAVDLDPSTPGIQVELSAQGGLPSLPLIVPPRLTEGATTVYAEYFEANSGKVTAAGDQTWNLTGDTQAPSLLWTQPASNCTSACLRTRDPLVFQFSEPMWISSLGNVRVDLYSASSSCTGSFSDWTASSTLLYDTVETALYVTTPLRSGTYSVRVRVPASVTDAASARNSLPALSRCVVFSTLSDAATPTTPQLIATPARAFSPDGDQSAESVTWNVSTDAATTMLRLRISRGARAVFGRLIPVSQAGQYSLSWDGADANGRIVNNGAYSYAIEALNRAGSASTALKGYVEVNSAVGWVTVRRRQ
jgi:hypothetical protein